VGPTCRRERRKEREEEEAGRAGKKSWAGRFWLAGKERKGEKEKGKMGLREGFGPWEKKKKKKKEGRKRVGPTGLKKGTG